MLKRRLWLFLSLLAVTGFVSGEVCLAQKPEAVESFKMGMSYKLQGSNFQAREKLQEALKIDPNYHQARVELAGVYADLNMLPEALTELKKASKSAQKVPKLRCYQGLVNYKLGLEVWTNLVQNHPEYLFKDKGTVKFIKEGLPAETQIDKLKKKIERDTTNLEARHELRGMYYEVAIAELSKAIKEAAKDTLANLTLGLVYLERGRKDLALKQQALLEKIDPKTATDLKNMINFVEEGKKEWEKELKERNLVPPGKK
ncbi:MAG: hypothetical protein A2142_05095 [candidate division Zixibacteria bacterium RBG_16_48_11]|nr:MAG: hypothetical protein A2142_05095 [candidate division Zixibacteria bacterium RBG_16_48_11]